MLQGDIDREEDLENLDISVDSLAGYLSNQRPVDIQTKQKYLQRFNEILTERKKKKKKKEKKDPPIGKPKTWWF